MSQIYKVFNNNKCLFFTNDYKNINIRTGDVFFEFTNYFDFEKIIQKFESIDFKYDIFLLAENIIEIFDFYKKKHNVLFAAGGIVRNQKQEILSIFRFNKWDLPKGHVELNEKYEDAALREVIEETGVKNLVLNKFIDITYHIYFIENVKYLKITYWYSMNCNNSEILIPQISEGITDVKWFNIKDLNIILNNSYSSINEIIKNYLKKENHILTFLNKKNVKFAI